MLEELKLYLRIDGEEEDNLLSSLLLSAQAYIKGATGKEVDPTNDLHKLAVFLFCSHQYENRNPVITGTVATSLEHSLNAVLKHIEWVD